MDIFESFEYFYIYLQSLFFNNEIDPNLFLPLEETLNDLLTELQTEELPPYNLPVQNDLIPNPNVDENVFISWDKHKICRNIYPDPINDISNQINPPPSLNIPLGKPIITFFTTYVEAFSFSIDEKSYGYLNAHPFVYNILYKTNYNSIDSLNSFYEQWINNNVQNYIENANFLGQNKTNINDNTFLKIILPQSSNNIFLSGDDSLNDLYNFYQERNDELENFKHNIRVVKTVTNVPTTQINVELTNTLNNFIVNNNLHTNFLLNQLDKISIPLEVLDDFQGKRKNELQIIWRHENYPFNKSTKIINLPVPKPIDNISKDLLKATLPSTFNFGLTRYNLRFKFKNEEGWKETIQAIVNGIGESDSDYLAFIENYKQWLENLCDENLYLQQWSVTHLDNDTLKPLKTGIYIPYKAIYMGWDNENQNLWIKKGRWILN